MTNLAHTKKTALLVDDDPCYCRLVELVFENLGLKNQLTVLKLPSQVLPHFLPPKKERPVHLPDLILLDLSMPEFNGIELTKQLREKKEFETTPTVIMSSSFQEETRDEAYRTGVDACLHKPSDLEDFLETFTVITRYWFSLVIAKSKEIR
jgi:two-component system, response regulator